MTFGLDTSVLLRLLVGRPPAQTARAVAFLDDVARHGDRAVVSDLVVAETYFALQHHYGVPKAQALSALHQLFAGGEIRASRCGGSGPGHARARVREAGFRGSAHPPRLRHGQPGPDGDVRAGGREARLGHRPALLTAIRGWERVPMRIFTS